MGCGLAIFQASNCQLLAHSDINETHTEAFVLCIWKFCNVCSKYSSLRGNKDIHALPLLAFEVQGGFFGSFCSVVFLFLLTASQIENMMPTNPVGNINMSHKVILRKYITVLNAHCMFWIESKKQKISNSGRNWVPQLRTCLKNQ